MLRHFVPFLDKELTIVALKKEEEMTENNPLCRGCVKNKNRKVYFFHFSLKYCNRHNKICLLFFDIFISQD